MNRQEKSDIAGYIIFTAIFLDWAFSLNKYVWGIAVLSSLLIFLSSIYDWYKDKKIK